MAKNQELDIFFNSLTITEQYAVRQRYEFIDTCIAGTCSAGKNCNTFDCAVITVGRLREYHRIEMEG